MWTTLRGFLRRRPAVSYFALTFAISWGGIVALIGPSGVLGTKEEFERLFPIAVPMMVLGPSVAGILLTRVVGGRAGLRGYRNRLLRWRVAPRWYAVALLLAPLYFLVCGLAYGAVSPELMPGIFTAEDTLGFVLGGMAVALTAGIVEELGWTGFATPVLRRRHGAFTTGLVVGAMWGLWHFLPKIWGAAAHDLVAWMPVDLLLALVGLTGFRILMVWVYDATESLFIGILMHGSLTASTLILQPLVTGTEAIVVLAPLSVAPWVIVAAVAWLRRRGGATVGWSAAPHPAR